MSRTSISIVSTSYSMSRVRDVFSLLESIKNQSCESIEVVFVVERTAELLERIRMFIEEIGLQNTKLLFNDGERGLSSSRNLALREVKGEVVAFVDDDVILPKDWAKLMVHAYELDSTVVGVAGPALPAWEDVQMRWFPHEFEWIISCTGWVTPNVRQSIRNVWGANFSFKRDVFQKCGTFSTRHGFPKGTYEGFLGEDNEFSMRAVQMTKGLIVYEPGVWVAHRIHKGKLTWRFILRRSFWMGYSRRLLKKSYVTTSDNILSPESKLVREVLVSFFPDTLKRIVHSPRDSLKRLILALFTLLSVSLGYAYGFSAKVQP